MKQYVVLCDDEGARILQDFVKPGLFKFIEVQGMSLSTAPAYALVTPIVPPLAQTVNPQPTPVQPAPNEASPVVEEVKY